MIAVYTYWSKNQNNCRFNSKEDLISSIKYSLLLSNKLFKDVVVFTDNLGIEFFNENGLSNLCSLDNSIEFEINNNINLYWAYAKIFTMKSIKQPFIHLDLDYYIYSRNTIDSNDYVFEGIDSFKESHNAIYNNIIKEQSFIDINIDYAYRCGLVSCKGNFELFDNLYLLADSFLTKIKYHEVWNLFIEQVLIAKLFSDKNLKVEIINPNEYWHLYNQKTNTNFINLLNYKLKNYGLYSNDQLSNTSTI